MRANLLQGTAHRKHYSPNRAATQLEQQQNPAVAVLAAWLTSAMRVCTSKPALRFTRLREASTAASAGLKIQTISDRNTGTARPDPAPARARALSCECGTQHADRGTKNCSGK